LTFINCQSVWHIGYGVTEIPRGPTVPLDHPGAAYDPDMAPQTRACLIRPKASRGSVVS